MCGEKDEENRLAGLADGRRLRHQLLASDNSAAM